MGKDVFGKHSCENMQLSSDITILCKRSTLPRCPQTQRLQVGRGKGDGSFFHLDEKGLSLFVPLIGIQV